MTWDISSPKHRGAKRSKVETIVIVPSPAGSPRSRNGTPRDPEPHCFSRPKVMAMVMVHGSLGMHDSKTWRVVFFGGLLNLETFNHFFKGHQCFPNKIQVLTLGVWRMGIQGTSDIPTPWFLLGTSRVWLTFENFPPTETRCFYTVTPFTAKVSIG